MNKINKAASLVLAASLACAATGCDLQEFFAKEKKQETYTSNDYGHELDPQVHELVADSEYQVIDENDGVVFETAVTDSEASSDIGLYDSDGNRVADFCDNGMNGDRIAGDRIYTCSYQPPVTEESEETFGVRIDDNETDTISIRYFDKLTDEDFETADKVADTLHEAVSEFKNEDGNISAGNQDKAIDVIADIAEKMCGSGEAVDYEVNKNYGNVLITLSSGITYVYENVVEGFEGGSADNDISVMTLQPCTDSLGTSVPDDAAGVVAGEYDNVSFTSNLDASSVTRETIKGFSSNQIIIWNGHGGFSTSLHSFVRTGEPAETSTASSQDYIEKRILITGADDNKGISFTYRFVDAYCGDMSNTLLYLGCCQGGHDGVLASSFLDKNCNLVIGFSETVLARYDRDIITNFFEKLAVPKKFLWIFNVGNRTALEAMTLAKETCGSDDGSEHHASPVMFGNTLYKISSAIDDDLQTATEGYTEALNSIQLDKSYVSVDEGGSVTVSVTRYPDGYDASDFVWSIDDPSVATVSAGTVTGVKKGSCILKIKSTDDQFSQFCAVTVK